MKIKPLYLEHVFAQIKPTTNSRIDLGLALPHYKRKLPKRPGPVRNFQTN